MVYLTKKAHFLAATECHRMADKPFKADIKDKVKLRAAEPTGEEANVSTGEPADGLEPSVANPNEAVSRPTSGTQTTDTISTNVAQDIRPVDTEQSEDSAGQSGRHDLLDILEDPNAHEKDWLAAANLLTKEERRKEREEEEAARGTVSSAIQVRNRRQRRFALLSIAAIAGVAALIAVGQFTSQPHPANVPSVGHMVPSTAKKVGDVDYSSYMADLQHQIKSNWHPPEGSATNHVVMHFKISKTGEISDVGFNRLSHISEADSAALKAVIESMPSVGPLPPGSPASVDVQFTFDYRVINAKKS
jgi:hypothetical protein